MRERLDARELSEWAAFERTYGPLTIQERVDAAGAVSAWAAVLAMHGSKDAGKVSDYLPDWAGEREQDGGQSAENMMAFMRSLQRAPKTKRS